MAANERELKLGVWAGFALPDVGLAAAPEPERRLEAVYYDTPDLRLLRHGVTVRNGDGVWVARLPSRDVRVEGGGGGLPAELAELTLGWAFGAPLAPVARLATVRRMLVLRDSRGREVATIGDDDVSVLRGKRVAARFRELELTAATPRALERLAGRLRDAGAQPVDQVPKLVRALGPAAFARLPVVEAGPGASAADVIRARRARAAARLSGAHAAVVLDGDADSIRALRAGARALRRDARAFAPLLGDAPKVGWLIDALTPVRRLDELLALAGDEGERGDAAAAGEAGDRGGGSRRGDGGVLRRRGGEAPGGGDARRGGADERARLRARLHADRAAALEVAREALRSPRYAALLKVLAEEPRPVAKASRPAADALPRLAREPLGRLRRELAPKPAEQLAAVTSAAVPYVDARKAARALGVLRDALRERRRALQAVDGLHALATRAPEHAWAAGLLAGEQSARAARAQAALPQAYERATRRRLWTWVP